MALNRKLSDKPFTNNYSDTARVHIYEPNDFSQSPTGSDYQVPASSLRDITANHFKNDYSIVSNTPILSNATGKLGDEVRCTDAGTRDFGSGDITAGVDDILMHNGSVWFLKVDNNQATDISEKQDTLVSGTNIKTINGNSILGSGDLQVSVPFDIIKDYPNQIVISATGNSFTNIGTYAQTVTGTQSDILIGGDGVAFRKILSATTAGSNANFYDSGAYRITGTKGFYYRARIKNDDPTNIPTARFSYGLSGTSIMGNINPSSYTQALLCFGADNSDTNCQIMYKLSGGATTKINLGATMPKSQTNDYVIEFWRLEGTTTINYKVHNLTTSAIVSGSFTFAFSGLALGCFRNNDIATTAVSFAVRRIELYIND